MASPFLLSLNRILQVDICGGNQGQVWKEFYLGVPCLLFALEKDSRACASRGQNQAGSSRSDPTVDVDKL